MMLQVNNRVRIREYDAVQWCVERATPNNKWVMQGYCRTRVGIEAILRRLKKPPMQEKDIARVVAELPEFHP